MPNYNNADLLDGIEIFFNAIKAKCLSYEEYAAEIIKARGFLLEDNALILSNNSHKDDADYLNKLLTKENIGKVEGNKIIIFPGGDVEKIFYSNIIGGSESCLAYGITFKQFLYYNFAPKVPVVLLEKFIARYVKAISACGVQTRSSCDGNHNDRRGRKLSIEISGEHYALWHKIICKKCLADKFNLHRNEGYDKIELNQMTKWKTYIELNRAAEFLYNHRLEIRAIRRKASDEIINNMTKKLSDAELAEMFERNANKLFDDLKRNIRT